MQPANRFERRNNCYRKSKTKNTENSMMRRAIMISWNPKPRSCCTWPRLWPLAAIHEWSHTLAWPRKKGWPTRKSGRCCRWWWRYQPGGCGHNSRTRAPFELAPKISYFVRGLRWKRLPNAHVLRVRSALESVSRLAREQNLNFLGPIQYYV